MRNPKGSVVVQSHKGMLRLQLPRHLFSGTQKYIYLGLPDTPINRRAADQKADVISADIAFDKFDDSLSKYRPSAIAPDSLPLLGEVWRQYIGYKAKTVSKSTFDKDFKRITNHIESLPTQKLKDARKIKTFLLETLTIESAKKVMMQISACCDWAVEEQIIILNPFNALAKIRTRKQRKKINPFTKEERDRIIKAFENSDRYKHYEPFVQFLFLTGCRTSEAIGLQWKHISSDLSKIKFSEPIVLGVRKNVTKTGGVRIFPVNSQLKTLLLRVRPLEPQPEILVFPSPEGLPIDSHNFLVRAWKKTIGELQIEYRPQYNTRHTFISLCLDAGVEVGQVADWVGNSPDTIWRHYAGLVNKKSVPEL